MTDVSTIEQPTEFWVIHIRCPKCQLDCGWRTKQGMVVEFNGPVTVKCECGWSVKVVEVEPWKLRELADEIEKTMVKEKEDVK